MLLATIFLTRNGRKMRFQLCVPTTNRSCLPHTKVRQRLIALFGHFNFPLTYQSIFHLIMYFHCTGSSTKWFLIPMHCNALKFEVRHKHLGFQALIVYACYGKQQPVIFLQSSTACYFQITACYVRKQSIIYQNNKEKIDYFPT